MSAVSTKEMRRIRSRNRQIPEIRLAVYLLRFLMLQRLRRLRAQVIMAGQAGAQHATPLQKMEELPVEEALCSYDQT
jgi:hypothetical protein